MSVSRGAERDGSEYILRSPPVLKTESVETGKGPITVEYRPRLSYSEFLNYYQLSTDKVMVTLLLATKQLLEGIGRKVPIKKLDGQLFFLSQLKHLGREAGEASEGLSNLGEYVQFMKRNGLLVPAEVIDGLRETFGTYQQYYLSPAKLRTGFPGMVIHTGLQPNEVSWVAMPKLGGYYLADKRIVNIAEKYRKDRTISGVVTSSVERPGDERFLVHDTTQVSLKGIAAEGGILSASELVYSRAEILSGEFLENVKPDNALFNVYASMSGVGSGNAEPRDLDEFTVSLIIGERAQAETMRKIGRQQGLSEDKIEAIIRKRLRRLERFEPIRSEDVKGKSKEEIRELFEQKRTELKRSDHFLTPQFYESFLGPRVPLENVVALAVPHKYVGEYRGWVLKNLLRGCQLLVREAAELVNTRL